MIKVGHVPGFKDIGNLKFFTFVFCFTTLFTSFYAQKSFALNIYENVSTLSSNVKNDLYRVYVPNAWDDTVTVIDPKTYSVVDTLKVAKDPQHIVPSYDFRTLWVLNDGGNAVTPIDPKTGKPGEKIAVDRPYNLYFTMDGKFAIVIDDVHKRFDFRDPHTMELIQSVPVNCSGLNHMDFSVDGSYAIASCEFSGELVKLDINNKKVLNYLKLDSKDSTKHPMPQDVRLSSDGTIFWVADMMMDGVHLIDPISFKQIDFIPTGKGPHSIYPSRDGKYMYVGNRGCNKENGCEAKGLGSIAVVDANTKKIIQQWVIPGGGSPDMGNFNSDNTELWLTGRYDQEVYVFNLKDGKLTQRIPVGRSPHGLTVWPQPGRYSLGHTGNMR